MRGPLVALPCRQMPVPQIGGLVLNHLKICRRCLKAGKSGCFHEACMLPPVLFVQKHVDACWLLLSFFLSCAERRTAYVSWIFIWSHSTVRWQFLLALWGLLAATPWHDTYGRPEIWEFVAAAPVEFNVWCPPTGRKGQKQQGTTQPPHTPHHTNTNYPAMSRWIWMDLMFARSSGCAPRFVRLSRPFGPPFFPHRHDVQQLLSRVELWWWSFDSLEFCGSSDPSSTSGEAMVRKILRF